MTDATALSDSLALVESLIARVELLEDKLAITELLTAYSPAVDSGSADEVANLWLEDGVYDVDTGAMHGRGELRAMVRSASHQNWIMNGAAHMMTPAHIRIDGNKAVATCHSQLVIKDPRTRPDSRSSASPRTGGNWSRTTASGRSNCVQTRSSTVAPKPAPSWPPGWRTSS